MISPAAMGDKDARTVIIHCQQHHEIRYTKLEHVEQGAEELALDQGGTIDMRSLKRCCGNRVRANRHLFASLNFVF